ncbi:MAG: hypothetical protein CMB80_06860 [Flammeovirgaceae bacterium]|nr:hypothetical protein [Flammeovirgaceae bacterium]MBE61788.1 hypothetical protein [Flammeovirgaceae bacterium]HCX23405.1 hypothetical protein [Cytophagales bacterium]
MLLRTPNVEVRLDDRFDIPCVNVRFIGKFTESTSIESTTVWKQTFQKHPKAKFIMVWDCMDMTGFEMSARREWLKHMHELHGQIDRIIVISDSVLIRGSARLMLKLFRFKSEMFNSHHDVWDTYSTFV